MTEFTIPLLIALVVELGKGCRKHLINIALQLIIVMNGNTSGITLWDCFYCYANGIASISFASYGICSNTCNYFIMNRISIQVNVNIWDKKFERGYPLQNISHFLFYRVCE